MPTTTQQPIISPPGGGDELSIAGSQVFHRAKSSEANGVFSVVELVSQPGTGVSTHVHDHEDELVYVLDGDIEVTLGDETMKAKLLLNFKRRKQAKCQGQHGSHCFLSRRQRWHW